METVITLLLAVMLPLTFIVIPLYMIFRYRLTSALKKGFPEIWETFPKQKALGNEPSDPQLIKHIKSSAFESMRDPVIISKAKIVKVLYYLSAFSFISAVFSLIAFMALVKTS